MDQGNENATRPSNMLSIIITAVLQGIGVVLLNAVSLILVKMNKQIAGRIKVCFAGQIITDFAVGIATVMLSIANFYGIFCDISVYMIYIFGAITSFMALLQTLDKFLMLRFTYAYSAWISERKMALIVFAIYVIISASTFSLFYQPYIEGQGCDPTLTGAKNGYIFMICLVFVCTLTIIVLHIYIGFKIRRHQKFSSDQQYVRNRVHPTQSTLQQKGANHGALSTSVDTHNTSVAVVEIISGDDDMKPTEHVATWQTTSEDSKGGSSSIRKYKDGNSPFRADDMKVLMIIILTAGLYGLCYLPLSIASVGVITNWNKRQEYVRLNRTVLFTCRILFTLNSILNPLVYIWRLKSFRINLGKCCKKK